MIPARTSGTKHRPTTAPARATARASSDRRREARQDRVLDRARHMRVADRLAVGARVVAEGAEQLLDVERDAVGALVDRAHHLARGGEPGRQDQRRHQRRLVVGERREPRLLGAALAEQPRPPLAVVRVERHLVRAVGPDRRAAGRSATSRATSPITSRLISSAHWRSSKASTRRPVDGVRDPLGEVADEDAPRAQRVAALRRPGRPASPAARRRGRRTRVPRASSAPGPWSTPGGRAGPGARDRPARSGSRPPRPCGGSRRSRRVLPMPASPASSTIWPRPAAASSMRRSASASRSSRPTRSGLRSGPRRLMRAECRTAAPG